LLPPNKSSYDVPRKTGKIYPKFFNCGSLYRYGFIKDGFFIKYAEGIVTLADLRSKRRLILALAKQYGARNIRIFGSVVSGHSKPESDIDLLIEMGEEKSLFDRIALKQDLEDLLGSSVDLVTDEGLHRVIKDKVLAEAVPL
jgi:uncharacterized protein